MIKFFKNIRVRAVFAALTVLMLIFIFVMSSYDGDSSAELSGGLLKFINGILSELGLNFYLTDHILRKTAHYTEYFILGNLYTADVLGWTGGLKKCRIYTLPAGLVTACLDEMSQSFSNGRTPKITDVFIDFSGILTAVLIWSILIFIMTKRKKRTCEL